MKDEVKEILDYLNIKGKKMIGIKQKELLLDYITNLQEENERLKELCDKYEEEHNTTFQKWLKELKGGEK